MIEVAHERGRFLELSARSERLDLSDVHCQLAKEKGVPVAIASGAFAPAELDFVRFGVDRARRGWLAPSDVLNCRPLDDLRRLLARR